MKQAIADFFYQPKVLVVDDEKRIRDGVYKMLTQEGFIVERAENGNQCLEFLRKNHYDIVLLDLMMPGLGGLEILPQIRSFNPDTIVIVITGYATIEHSIEAMKKGAFDFIPKPFSPKDVRLIISKALDYIRTLQDISTEKSRMRVLIDYLADGVLTTDNKKRIALANPKFLKMIHFTGGELIGQPVDQIVKDPRVLQMIDDAMAISNDAYGEVTLELVYGKPDASYDASNETIIGARCVPFRDRLERTLGTITVMHDITALKKMDQLKSDFVSMVAHEIRSPLNSIQMQLKVILDGLAGEVSQKQQEILSRATEKINSLSTLSSELLDLAKIESGLINQEKEKMSMAKILEELVVFYQERASGKSIDLKCAPIQSECYVIGNKCNIEEVASNLISNAIRYTPEGGEIVVGANEDSNYVNFKVQDNGYGIDKADQARIFDRFFRVKNNKTRFITGTGLGLAIVKSIVEAHHGTIQLDSEPNCGSTFTVYLPKIQ